MGFQFDMSFEVFFEQNTCIQSTEKTIDYKNIRAKIMNKLQV